MKIYSWTGKHIVETTFSPFSVNPFPNLTAKLCWRRWIIMSLWQTCFPLVNHPLRTYWSRHWDKAVVFSRIPYVSNHWRMKSMKPWTLSCHQRHQHRGCTFITRASIEWILSKWSLSKRIQHVSNHWCINSLKLEVEIPNEAIVNMKLWHLLCVASQSLPLNSKIQCLCVRRQCHCLTVIYIYLVLCSTIHLAQTSNKFIRSYYFNQNLASSLASARILSSWFTSNLSTLCTRY